VSITPTPRGSRCRCRRAAIPAYLRHRIQVTDTMHGRAERCRRGLLGAARGARLTHVCMTAGQIPRRLNPWSRRERNSQWKLLRLRARPAHACSCLRALFACLCCRGFMPCLRVCVVAGTCIYNDMTLWY
jgi:hypothetical protein